MDGLVVAAAVVKFFTKEDIQSAEKLTSGTPVRTFVITTSTGRTFTVDVNIAHIADSAVGNFFEGREPTKSQLRNFNYCANGMHIGLG